MQNKRTPNKPRAADAHGLSPKKLARLEQAYTATDLTLQELRAAFALTRGQLQTLCTERGWLRRKNEPKQKHQNVCASNERTKINAPPNRDLNTLKRCTRLLLECQMREIERECADSKASTTSKSAADREKDARTLANLTRTLEKLTELEQADTDAKALGTEKHMTSSPADDTGKSIDEIRIDLERRLRQLVDEDNP